MKTILFLCIHNAGRSQMAAGFARELKIPDLIVLSAGSNPAAQINPIAVQAMREVGIDISTQTPQKLTDEMVAAADIVVTMGCGDKCPYYPGKKYLDWELVDPAGAELAAVREIRDEIQQRVNNLLMS